MKPYNVEVTKRYVVSVAAMNAIEAKKQVDQLFVSGDISLVDGNTITAHAYKIPTPKPQKAVSVSVRIRDILEDEGLLDTNRWWAFKNDKGKVDRKLKWFHTGMITKVTGGDINSDKAKKVTNRIKKKLKLAGIEYKSAGFRQCLGYQAFIVRLPL